MGVVKVPENNGRAWYRLDGTVPGFDKEAAGYSIRYEIVGNFLVIRTAPGGAPGLSAVLDRRGWDEIVGTIAGDDTILVIGRTTESIAAVAAKLDTIM
jgi:arginine repressor